MSGEMEPRTAAGRAMLRDRMYRFAIGHVRAIEDESWNAALQRVEEAVAGLTLYDERDRVVTMAGDTRELRTMADAAEAIRTRAVGAIASLRKPVTP